MKEEPCKWSKGGTAKGGGTVLGHKSEQNHYCTLPRMLPKFCPMAVSTAKGAPHQPILGHKINELALRAEQGLLKGPSIV
jgi:hypothetical protein